MSRAWPKMQIGFLKIAEDFGNAKKEMGYWKKKTFQFLFKLGYSYGQKNQVCHCEA